MEYSDDMKLMYLVHDIGRVLGGSHYRGEGGKGKNMCVSKWLCSRLFVHRKLEG